MLVVFTNKLFRGKPISRFGAALLVFMFVVLISLAALFAFFPARRQKQLRLFKTHSPCSSRRPSGQVIFKINILFKFSFTNRLVCALMWMVFET